MKRQLPKYRILYDKLRQEITSGSLPSGRKLPSKRTLAASYGLSLVTVEHALELLEQEGYVASRERSGVTVIYRAGEFLKTPDAIPEENSPSGADRHASQRKTGRASLTGEPFPTFPISVLSKTARKVISEQESGLLVKSPNEGLLRFRTAISDYLDRNRGIRVTPDEIFIGSGAEYLYGLIVEALGPEKTFGIEDPSYEKIRLVYERKGVKIEALKLGKDGIRTEELMRSKADVLHISPFRSFPSGVTAGASKKQEYLDWLKKGKRVIVEDDFESEFSLLRKPEDTVYALSAGRNVIYLNSFSRTISPALRVGYMVLPRALTGVFRKRVGFYSCTVPVFEQLLITELLESGDFERHLNRIRRNLRKAGES